MTMDGGLERLVRILHDFCISPPPPDNPASFYGLSPAGVHAPKPVPTLLPKTYDKHAAYRFSLAFQCIVNIGVRGSEPIRSRVVQAGTLEVVGCILEAWLASKGFPIGPSLGANGMPRETREQRLARRQAQLENRQREQAAAIARALERQLAAERLLRPNDASIQSIDISQDEPMQTDQATPGASRAQDTDTSADTSTNATPNGGNTPTGTVVVPARDRSGTIIARPVWDQPTNAGGANARRPHRSRLNVPAASAGPSTSTSAANSRPETETEDDGDVDMDRESRDGDAPSPSPERQPTDTGTIRATHSRRAVGIVTDAAGPAGPGASMDMNSDPHIVINDEGVVTGVGVEDGIVSLEANDDFAMGAPPGAPGAIDGPPARAVADTHAGAGERTPRAGTANLPMTAARPTMAGAFLTAPATELPRPTEGATPPRANAGRGGNATNNAATATPGGAAHHHHHHHHAREAETGPYRDEDVLLSLQLLAYLSKYPHCREAFYTMRPSFHPATLHLASEGRYGQASSSSTTSGASAAAATASSSRVAQAANTSTSGSTNKDMHPFVKAFNIAAGRGKEKEKERTPSSSSTATSSTAAASASGGSRPRMTNVFALVERFTYRHSSSELESSNPPPSLPPEIQYWAGVIMRNACRKDDSRGGIRQCANSESLARDFHVIARVLTERLVLCGKWERFPREFAKCRRCRKAKYCGKECQSTAWSEGHRFWCSAKDPEEDGEHHHHHGESSRGPAGTGNGPPATATAAAAAAAAGAPGVSVTAGGTVVGRSERREARERERQARAVAAETRLAAEDRGNAPDVVPQRAREASAARRAQDARWRADMSAVLMNDAPPELRQVLEGVTAPAGVDATPGTTATVPTPAALAAARQALPALTAIMEGTWTYPPRAGQLQMRWPVTASDATGEGGVGRRAHDDELRRLVQGIQAAARARGEGEPAAGPSRTGEEGEEDVDMMID
ncbi:MYND-type zinc finger protein samB [Trametes pubescens]|uniref:MYND-type zinc finger protein samB n=1 Tax=Trametes pubescens TaxID=154538 RepID=A0A1M2VJS7_TRAPU|nr:MYND-type zinc finger protein samB [Trametes pubescens]